jgi:hypothetical protein
MAAVEGSKSVQIGIVEAGCQDAKGKERQEGKEKKRPLQNTRH